MARVRRTRQSENVLVGELYERQGRSADAAAAYRRALELLPENSVARAALARVQAVDGGGIGGTHCVARSS